MRDVNGLMGSFLFAACIAVVIGVISAVLLARALVRISRQPEEAAHSGGTAGEEAAP